MLKSRDLVNKFDSNLDSPVLFLEKIQYFNCSTSTPFACLHHIYQALCYSSNYDEESQEK